MKGNIIYYGHIFNASGYAQESRKIILAMHKAGYRVKAVPISETSNTNEILDRETHQILFTLTKTDLNPEQSVCIFSAPADSWNIPQKAYHLVGRTMFETDRISPQWVARCNNVHEVWIPSSFNMETFKTSGVEPSKLYLMPIGIDTGFFKPGLKPLSIPDIHSYNFLSVFDWQLRKGWDVLLKGYLTEFSRNEDVALILKVSNYFYPKLDLWSALDRFAQQEIGHPLSECPTVVILPSFVSDREMPYLYASVDAFVLPTRGEGWGLPLMEAMSSGLPTIATKWSGQLDFMNKNNSYLLDCRAPVPVSPQNDIHVFNTHCWAEPDVSHLRYLMRYIYSNRKEAADKGQQARKDIVKKFDQEQITAKFLQEVERILS